MHSQGSLALGFVSSRCPGRAWVCTDNFVPWLVNVRLTIAGSTGKVTGEFDPPTPTPTFPGSFPFQEIGRAFAFLPSDWAPGPFFPLSQKGTELPEDKMKETWVASRSDQAAVSSSAKYHFELLRSSTGGDSCQ